jgi:hypothetical protein
MDMGQEMLFDDVRYGWRNLDVMKFKLQYFKNRIH